MVSHLKHRSNISRVLGDANTAAAAAAATGYQLQVQVIFSPYDRLYLYVQFNTAVSLFRRSGQ